MSCDPYQCQCPGGPDCAASHSKKLSPRTKVPDQAHFMLPRHISRDSPSLPQKDAQHRAPPLSSAGPAAPAPSAPSAPSTLLPAPSHPGASSARSLLLSRLHQQGERRKLLDFPTLVFLTCYSYGASKALSTEPGPPLASRRILLLIRKL